MLSRKWLVAGLLAMLATAAHPTLTVLIPVLGIIALHAIWTKRDWRSLIAPVVAPLGVLGYFAYYGHQYHDYLFWFRIERALAPATSTGASTNSTSSRGPTPRRQRTRVFNALVIIMFWASVIGIGLLIAARAPWPSRCTPRPSSCLACCPLAAAPGRGSSSPCSASSSAPGETAQIPVWPTLVVSAGLLAFVIGWWPHNLPPSP